MRGMRMYTRHTGAASLMHPISKMPLSALSHQQKADAPCVLFRQQGALGRISLNKPRKLHTLDLEMVRLIDSQLDYCFQCPDIAVILIDSTSHKEKGIRPFAAGGDIVSLAKDFKEGSGDQARTFLSEEYRMNHKIFCSPKPVIACADGVCLGGGLGVFGAAQWRVATPRAVFGAPELLLGATPDVGIRLMLMLGNLAIAQQLVYTGQFVGAYQAMHDLKIVNRMVYDIDGFADTLSHQLPTIEFGHDNDFTTMVIKDTLLSMTCSDRGETPTLASWTLPLDATDSQLLKAIDTKTVSPLGALVTKRQLQIAKEMFVDRQFTVSDVAQMRVEDFIVFTDLTSQDDFLNYVYWKFINKGKGQQPAWNPTFNPDSTEDMEKAKVAVKSFSLPAPQIIPDVARLHSYLQEITLLYSGDLPLE